MLSIKEVDRKYIGKYFEKEFWHWQNKYFAKINLASSKPEIGMVLLAEIINKPKIVNVRNNVPEVDKQVWQIRVKVLANTKSLSVVEHDAENIALRKLSASRSYLKTELSL